MKSLLERMDDFERRLERLEKRLKQPSRGFSEDRIARLERLVGIDENGEFTEGETHKPRKCYDAPEETYDDSESY